jgi:hypothetical protein
MCRLNFTAEKFSFFQENLQNPLKKQALCGIIYDDLMGKLVALILDRLQFGGLTQW